MILPGTYVQELSVVDDESASGELENNGQPNSDLILNPDVTRVQLAVRL